MSKKTGGIVVLVACLALSVFLLNCGSSNSRPAGVLFVTSAGATTVQSFSINLNNGDLSQLNTSATTCSSGSCGAPGNIILDPTKAVAFVLNQGDPNASPAVPPSIYGYTTQSNGSLSGAADVSTSLGVFTPGDSIAANGTEMVRDSAGKFLFVVTQGNVLSGGALQPQLLVFGTQPGSTSLTAVGTLPLTQIPTAISAITLTLPGTSSPETLLFVTRDKDLGGNIDNTVSVYSVDSSGTVTEEPNSPYPTGTLPSAVLPVFTQSNFLFVFIADGIPNNNIVTYQVCIAVSSDCSNTDVQFAKMTPVGSATAVGTSPLDMITDATRRFLYVANSQSNTVSSFSISPTTGKLSALNPATVSTGATPVALALHPNGEFIYSANSGSANGVGSVSGFTVNLTSGSLGGGIQVSSSPQPAGLVAK